MNPKLKQYAYFQVPGGSTDTISVIKNGPGTLHAVIAGVDANGQDFANNANAKYYLFDNSASASGALITAQYDGPEGKILEFDIDFTQGLTIKVEHANYTAGSLTVIFS
jgi:hypothetical protein